MYTSTNPDKQNLNDYIYRTKLESKVNQEDMNVCDGQLSVEECTEAIFKMKLNKSPGIDGLTVELYRIFWESITYLIVFILSKCHEDRQLSFSQRTSDFNDIPEFYKEIINCWVEFGCGQTKTPTNFREIRNQNIWGNKYIKFNNKSLIYKNWIDSNLLYVNDITDENGRTI